MTLEEIRDSLLVKCSKEIEQAEHNAVLYDGAIRGINSFYEELKKHEQDSEPVSEEKAAEQKEAGSEDKA